MSCNIKPVGHRVLVKPEKVEKTTEGGIILTTVMVDAEQRASTKGIVLDIGPTAWLDYSDGKPWAKIGDVVIFKAHTGMRVKNNEEDEDYLLLMNDGDLAAIYKGES